MKCSSKGRIKLAYTSNPFGTCATIKRMKPLVWGKWVREVVSAVIKSGGGQEEDEFSTVPGGNDHRVIHRSALDFFEDGFDLDGAGLDAP
jgi:hypothetical protein